ncbi:MAG: type III pantothenate kinase [Bacteroidales bacterium]|nr:type III pantothenate kinase [Bacteroidales bacterium]
MNLTLDIGNTAVKWGLFDGRELKDCGYGMPEESLVKANNTLACASGKLPKSMKVQSLTADKPLPIRLDYKTPKTVGADRIADACGAAGMHPGEPCLVIDAGTCITVDFVDADGIYHGGAIMPGLKMNLQALHTFTAKLPLIDIEGVEKAPVLGRSTEESILAGTMGATLLALAGFVALYKEKAPNLRVLLTGGDAEKLMASGAKGWEHVPHLTLIGLNEILIYNEK